MMKIKYLFYTYVCLLAFLCGCTANAANRALIDDSEHGYPLDGMERAYYDADVPFINAPVKTAERFESENRDEERRALELKARIEKVPSVSSAAVVINNNTAIIGVTLKGEPNDDKIMAVKRHIKQIALELDSELSHAAVTAAPELYERINLLLLKPKTAEGPTKSTSKRELFPITPSF